jgi:hypothetical protein
VVSCVNDAGVAPVVVSQTSPDDLLTDQTPPSAANAPEHPARAIASASMPRIPIPVLMRSSAFARPAGSEEYGKSLKIRLVEPHTERPF